MGKQTFVINGSLEGYNEHEKKRRGNPYAANSAKVRTENAIAWSVKAAKIQPVSSRQWVMIEWHEDISGRKRGRDPDNIASRKKFILDALQKAKVLPNDNRKYIAGFTDRFVYEKEKAKVIVTLADYVEDM